MQFLRKATYWVLLAAMLTAGGFLLFTQLGEAIISECDEARHGVNAYEMMQSGDYLVSTYRGETDYWNLKPPLSLYSIILGYQLFGFNAFGMRFYSALSMLLTMLVLALWMKRRYGSAASLGTLGFMLACSMIYGPHFARFGDADAQMVLFYTISMLCMLESRKNLRWLYGSAVCFGLAFMSKSWHAALIPVTCLLYVCVTGLIKKLNWKQYLLLLFWGLLPIAPWAVARYLHDGMAFFAPMFTKDVVARATTVHETHYGDVAHYVRVLMREPVVALTAVFIAAALLWKLVRRSRIHADHWGVALWMLTPLFFFSICVSKLDWYIFPCLPALAVGLGMVLGRLLHSLKGSACIPRIACAVIAFGLMGYWTSVNWNYVSAEPNQNRYQLIMTEYFDREYDSGERIYIQYESQNKYSTSNDYRVWVQDDVLTAQLCGDLVCLDGGIDAFLEEEEHAYLICHDVGMDWTLLEEYPILSEEGPVMLLEN